MFPPSEGTPLLTSQNIQSSPHTMTEMFCSCRRFSNRKFLVDILAILFGISAWISINGMFMQLPLMVQTQPEGWNLPSYLSVIIQIANVGPVLYSISQKLFPGRIKDCWIIYVILSFGTIALLLMGFFYHKTTDIGGSEHSTALFILSFFGALVGCTSSVLFMPFMSNFREIYLISYFVGEGLSGFLPSVVGLIQGVGGNPVCVPSADNSSVVVPYTAPPRFSTQAFFFFLFAMMTLSTVSFFLLNNLRLCESERTDSQPRSRAPSTKYSQTLGDGSPRANRTPDFNPIFTVREDVEALMKEQDICKTHHHKCNNTAEHTSAKSDVTSSPPKTQSLSDTKPKSLSNSVYIYFLVTASWVCMFGNGIFPSIQSYSCLPYGNVAYHLSVALGSMANPMACFLAFFYPYSSVKTISTLASLSTIITGYIMATALLSPVPPLVNTAAGEALVVISWVAVTGLITYVKVSIASVLRLQEGRALFWCGAVQQMGSAVGAILFFFLINYTKLFTSYYPCT
ncbi:solute carrier family 52, riboflavin transporter, member 3-A isoform X2 [Periplaneta americana]|uniref:solute carrier family 52, riboflavin transporter, member 3-A isoform X2 n=1 Tax=Periplaneta americana TaxID=6978 RepID=UPI0037E80D0B